MVLADERAAVAAAGRALAAERLVTGTSGNLSVRAGDRIAVTPTGVALDALEAADVTVVDLDGSRVDGERAPTSEVDLHLATYRLHGAGAVIHTHSPAATALACVLDEVPCIHYLMLGLGGAVPVVGYETFGTPELAESVARALEGRAAVLMANHGTVTLGKDLDDALANARLLEWCCDLYSRASAAGRPRELTPDEQEAARVRLGSYHAR